MMSASLLLLLPPSVSSSSQSSFQILTRELLFRLIHVTKMTSIVFSHSFSFFFVFLLVMQLVRLDQLSLANRFGHRSLMCQYKNFSFDGSMNEWLMDWSRWEVRHDSIRFWVEILWNNHRLPLHISSIVRHCRVNDPQDAQWFSSTWVAHSLFLTLSGEISASDCEYSQPKSGVATTMNERWSSVCGCQWEWEKSIGMLSFDRTPTPSHEQKRRDGKTDFQLWCWIKSSPVSGGWIVAWPWRSSVSSTIVAEIEDANQSHCFTVFWSFSRTCHQRLQTLLSLILTIMALVDDLALSLCNPSDTDFHQNHPHDDLSKRERDQVYSCHQSIDLSFPRLAVQKTLSWSTWDVDTCDGIMSLLTSSPWVNIASLVIVHTIAFHFPVHPSKYSVQPSNTTRIKNNVAVIWTEGVRRCWERDE